MKTLHLYLTRQVLGALLLTVAVFTFILLLGNVLKEVLALLVNRQATLWMVGQAIALLIPFVLVFALPMGMLTATLLVFGRFSADQELTAVRANGISLVALVTPILLLSVVLSGVCAWVNLEIAPYCRTVYKDLFLRAATDRPEEMLAEGRFITDFPNFVIYVSRRDGTLMKNVTISQLDSNGVATSHIRAARARVVSGDSRDQLGMELAEVHGLDYRDNQWHPWTTSTFPISFDLNQRRQKQRENQVGDMTFTQLQAKLAELKAQGLDATPVRLQMHQQVSFSFACIGFTLIGVPLGIRAHRRETSIGMAIALVLVAIYYSFILLGHAFETRPQLHPQWIVWLPNFLFQIVGGWLLWRANRRG